MLSFQLNTKHRNHSHSSARSALAEEKMRAVAYSMDILAPGLYFWCGNFVLRLGGYEPDDEPYRYPGTIHSFFGVAVVLPGYRIFTTYSGTYDPRQTSD